MADSSGFGLGGMDMIGGGTQRRGDSLLGAGGQGLESGGFVEQPSRIDRRVCKAHRSGDKIYRAAELRNPGPGAS
jgi:hypothetical protein